MTAPSATADTAPPAGTPSTVSADALATWQIDGVVWSQAVVGNLVFAGGQFSHARPPGVAAGGAGQVAAGNFLVYDITTGNRVASFAHSFNGQVNVVKASPDGSTVYVGGDFTSVDGTARSRIAAIDAKTGALTPFNPSLSGSVDSIAASASTVYAGGRFSSANGVTHARLAAFNAASSALLPWNPSADNKVAGMVLSPDGSKLVVGGSFTTLDGAAASGLGAIDTSPGATGASLPWAANTKIMDGGTKCGITNLTTDGTQVYGSGFAFGCGNFEGTFALDFNTGAINWANDCHGDTYDTFPVNHVLYSVSHAHNCSAIGGFFQSNPWSINMHHALAFSTDPTGTNAGPDDYGWDFSGVPDSSLLHWYPDLAVGSFTGQTQAAWSVSGNSNYVVLGGEFPKVNGTSQQGLVRFAVHSIAPNKRGPAKASDAPAPSATSLSSGTARVAWQAPYDMDNQKLSYSLYRSGTASPIYTTTQDSNFWDHPMMGYVDKNLTPGATYSYTVKVSDPDGNTLTLPKTNTVTVNSAAPSAYAQDVLNDGASDFWRLGEASGSTVYDYAGFNDATANAGVARGAAGAINGDSDNASTFDGADDGYVAENSTQATTPSFSIESWVKTTSTSGGKIVGYGDSNSGDSSSYDRHVYMDDAGHVIFGVYPGGVRTLKSTGTFNDGSWHHIVATLSSTSGMALYIDGKKVGSDQGTTSAQDYTGYWRIGGDNLNGWDNQPSSNKLAGSIDDVAIYPTALGLGKVQQHYIDSGRTLGGVAPKPADAYGKAVYDDNPDLYWRLGESSGSTAKDSGPNGEDGSYFGGTTQGQAGALSGTSDTAVAFDGSSGGVSSVDMVTNPTTYSEELWFKTTTNQGGKLIGFGNHDASGQSDNYDRHVYMEDSGQLTFGVWNNEADTITSPSSYNDGGWHHMVAEQSGAGIALYVDGAKVASDPSITTAQDYSGYWRVGGDSDWGGSSPWFNGTIDEVAVYSTALSDSDVASHHALGTGGTPPPVNQSPTAAFTSGTSNLTASFDATGSSDPDGDSLSYSWDFGDSTAAGSGATPNHTYASGGTYQVKLTVDDGKGGTDSVTHDVTVAAPNQSPTAAFTSSVTNLDASFDATGSSDPDGDSLSYSWDFGDGTTGTGVKPTHHYTSAGTKTVKLTVSDGKGGTGTVSHDVAPTAPAGATLIGSDDFGRTVSNGWGTADLGGAWTVGGTKSQYKVGGGVATMTLASAGATATANLANVSTANSDLQLLASPQAMATGAGTYTTVYGRVVGSASYRTTLVFKSNGTVTLGMTRVAGGTSSTLVGAKTVAGLTYAAGDQLNLRVQTVGTSPTTIRARVWKAGTAEPSTWQMTTTDSTAALQSAGSVTVASYLSGSSTNTPAVMNYDAMRLYDTGGA